MARLTTIRRPALLALAVLTCCPAAVAGELSRGHRVLLERGLQIQAMTFVPVTGYFGPEKDQLWKVKSREKNFCSHCVRSG